MRLGLLIGVVVGYRGPARRVIGGYEAEPFQYNFMVAIYEDGSYVCGGSLVQANVVLTAAHCVEGAPEEYQIKVNRHNLALSDSTELKLRVRSDDPVEMGKLLTFKAKAILLHPNYYRTNEYPKYDIALVKLNRTNSAQGILLDSSDSEREDTLGTLIGWERRRRDYRKSSPVLIETNLPVVDSSICELCQFNLVYSPIELCVGFPEGETDASFGDSGSPLFIQSESGPIIIGITSWTNPRDGYKSPTIFSRVSAFSPWILNNLS